MKGFIPVYNSYIPWDEVYKIAKIVARSFIASGCIDNDDLASAAVVRAYKQFPENEGFPHNKTYLREVIRSSIIIELKRVHKIPHKKTQKYFPEFQTVTEGTPAYAPPPEHYLDHMEDIFNAIRSELLKEHPRNREIFIKWLSGWTPKQLAEHYGFAHDHGINKILQRIKKGSLEMYLTGTSTPAVIQRPGAMLKTAS